MWLALLSIRLSSFKKFRITNAFDGTENDILRDNSDHDCLDLKSELEESVD
jgi:hypothetical protein